MDEYSDRTKRLFAEIDQWQPIFTLWVPGLPATSGSKRAIPKQRADGSLYSVVMPANVRQKDWQTLIGYTARQAFSSKPTTRPVRLHALFVFKRPQSHLTPKGVLRKRAPTHPVGHNLGDLTKLVRAVEDALNGVIWIDDSQVIEQANGKSWGEFPGVMLRVFEVKEGSDVQERLDGVVLASEGSRAADAERLAD